MEQYFDFSDIKYPNGQIEIVLNLGETSPGLENVQGFF